ncbi:MAG: caspase family protein [Rhizobiales bacterium]|nr:caspase family protein [Hyphomicrobiales bacterium]
MLNRLLYCLVALTMLIGSSTGAWAQERLALIVGNSKYQSLPTLANPSWDVQAIGSLLNSAGFEVTTALDLGQVGMRRKVREFTSALAAKGPDSVALVYFAGHGVQIDGQNYLLPVDAKIKTAADVPLEAVRLADVMNLLNEAPSQTRIVILDACRNDPFDAIKDKIGRGLAIVNAPAGTVVAYSTSPGSVAYDGETTFSPFTKALIEAAAEPGAGVATVFQNARLAVHKATNGLQTPWEVTALTQPFQFFPGTKKPLSEKSQDAWKNDLRSRSAKDAYDIVVQQNNVTVYQIFLAIFPNGDFSDRIRIITDRRLEMLAWYDAVTLNTIEAYQAFLERYPESDLALTAKRLMERTRARLQVARTGPGALDIENTQTNALAPVGDQKEVIKTVVKVKTVIKKVPVIKYKTIVKKVRVPVIKYREVIRRVPVIKYRTVVRTVRVPVRCKCHRRQRRTHTLQ